MTGIDTQVEEVEKMFAVNVFGPMRMVHFFHLQLVHARGKIVNIGSVGGIVPYVYGCKQTDFSSPLHVSLTHGPRQLAITLAKQPCTTGETL